MEIARPTPTTKFLPLYSMSCFSGLPFHSATKRCTTCDGPVKNSGEILPASHNHSQMPSATSDGTAAEDQRFVPLVERAARRRQQIGIVNDGHVSRVPE